MTTHPLLYLDMLSQPSRAVEILCRVNGLDVERKIVRIGRGEHQTPEYLAVNPLGKVPFLVDGDTSIGDSIAIMIYLCEKYKLAEHWYPQADIKAQARVNTVLGWHGSTLRIGSTLTIFNRVIGRLRGLYGDEHIVKNLGLPRLKDALQKLNDVWLKDSEYVAGNDISIADLLLATEVDMSFMLNAAPQEPSFERLLEPYPKVRAWLARLRKRCAPHYEETNQTLEKTVPAITRALKAKAKL